MQHINTKNEIKSHFNALLSKNSKVTYLLFMETIDYVISKKKMQIKRTLANVVNWMRIYFCDAMYLRCNLMVWQREGLDGYGRMEVGRFGAWP